MGMEFLDFKISVVNKPRQATVRFKTHAGWTTPYRLRDSRGNQLLVPKGIHPDNMGDEFRATCNSAAFRLSQKLIKDDMFRVSNRGYKMCIQAMDAFIAANPDRDYHHGNSFKEYFKDNKLAEVSRKKVHEFVEWLLEKYERKEATVSKKVFAASAMFKWLKEDKNMWYGENPFKGAIKNVKFAPTELQKSIITSEELESLYAVLDKSGCKPLRVLCEVIYCTGLRPGEALALKWEDFNVEHSTLTYLRTKRKGKTPDLRRIPIPSRLVTYVINEGATSGKIFSYTHSYADTLLRRARNTAQIGDLTIETFRHDFSTRARHSGASVDDVNLYQGRRETILEKYYTTDKWFIVHQCRLWIDNMFGERPELHVVNEVSK